MYSRRLGADEGTVLMACSICGLPFRYPTELRYCSDRLFRCLRYCTETENMQDYNDKMANSRACRTEEVAPRGPLAPKPSWY